MEAVALRSGIKAALCVHIELTVALTPIYRCAIEGVFALDTLNGRKNKHYLSKIQKYLLEFKKKEKKRNIVT